MDTPSLLALTGDHPYPLIRGGGLFLIFVGLGFTLGWLFPRRWVPLAIGGGIAGITASGLSALLPSLGSPSLVHIGALAAAIVAEMGLIALVVNRFRESGERTLIGWILLVVGAHFVLMGLAHGPLIALLGVLATLNALAALTVTRVPLRAFGLVDGLLKLGFGLWMLLEYPAFTYGF
ncbi:DUF6609 family protein [Longispora albida]|uniref:DUF6609 family protein n=1 Tax=Longispora albida TaxID=203523 RepID=UPI000361808F|nr:DUF6609 family protein [Longispora albida]